MNIEIQKQFNSQGCWKCNASFTSVTEFNDATHNATTEAPVRQWPLFKSHKRKTAALVIYRKSNILKTLVVIREMQWHQYLAWCIFSCVTQQHHSILVQTFRSTYIRFERYMTPSCGEKVGLLASVWSHLSRIDTIQTGQTAAVHHYTNLQEQEYFYNCSQSVVSQVPSDSIVIFCCKQPEVFINQKKMKSHPDIWSAPLSGPRWECADPTPESSARQCPTLRTWPPPSPSHACETEPSCWS